MMGPRWTDKLARPVRDAVANATLHTREDARRHIERIAVERGLSLEWHVAMKLLLAGSDADSVTNAIEQALRYERRFNDK